MIEKYRVKNINGEEVLLLYIDLNSEFGRFNFKDNTNINDIIKNFIKENKIAFMGTTVALIAGTTLLGKVYLNNQVTDDYKYHNNVLISELVDINDIDSITPLYEEKTVIDNSVKNQNTTTNTTTNNVIINRQIETNNKTNIPTKKDLVEVINEEIITEPQNVEEETDKADNKRYVTLQRNNGSIINIELEEYVMGVVAAEMPALFHSEALKAQAILARTYALKTAASGKVLTDNNSTQNYKSVSELQTMWGSNFNTYYNRISEAVNSTTGMYLSYNGDYIEAVYHSTSNGMTEIASNVWGISYPYLISVESPYDDLNPSFIKELFISYGELSLKLGTTVNKDTEFNILERSISGRVLGIRVNDKIFSGVNFRNILGLRSTDFEITKTDDGIVFKTRGYGHGVGLSQYGANGYAKEGYDYTQILSHYYPGTTLSYL